jgi:formate-dependent nitrite reductase membrane component NrfD
MVLSTDFGTLTIAVAIAFAGFMLATRHSEPKTDNKGNVARKVDYGPMLFKYVFYFCFLGTLVAFLGDYSTDIWLQAFFYGMVVVFFAMLILDLFMLIPMLVPSAKKWGR